MQPMRPSPKVLSDTELRDRLEQCNADGFMLARGAITAELKRREAWQEQKVNDDG